MLKRRIAAVEKRLRPITEGGPVRVWTIYGHNEEELAREREKITSGKVRNADGSYYTPGNHNLFLDIVYTGAPGELEHPKDEPQRGRGHAD